MKDRQTDRLLGQLPWELGLAELSQNGQVGGRGRGGTGHMVVVGHVVSLACLSSIGVSRSAERKFGLQLH